MLNLEVTKELSALHYELHSINLKLNNLAIEQEVFSKSAKDEVEYELQESKLNIKLSECVNKIETTYLLLDEFEGNRMKYTGSKYKLYKVTFNENALDWLDVLPDNLVFRSKTHEDVVQYIVHCIFPTVSYCLDCFSVDKVDVRTLFKTV